MKRLLREICRLAHDLRGAAATEFAIIAVPLILVMIGTVDFGRVMFAENGLSHAADIGARVILLDNGAANAEVEAAIRDAFTAGAADALNVSLGTASEAGVDVRTIELTYGIDLITPFIDRDALVLDHERRVPVVN